MKFLRYGKRGEEKPGLLDIAGKIRDLSSIIHDLNPQTIKNATWFNPVLDINVLPIVDAPVRIGACVGSVGKVVCVGLNSALHTSQMGLKTLSKKEMLVFMKPSSSVCGPNDPILHTRHTKKLDWEAELAIVIGKQGKYIKAEDAKSYIFGYTCMNDLSERYLQLEMEDKQFTKGKCFDDSAPLGPYLVTKDDIVDPNNLDVKLWVNGELRQEFNTSDYIHNDAQVVSYVSQFFTLYPGDIISMGSAPGNAIAWGEDKFLKPKDRVTFTISGLGEQHQEVIVEPESI